MVKIRSIEVEPAIINSSCAWSSDRDQLQALYDCPYTGAVTTRTATIGGFSENDTHRVAFMNDEAHLTSINSYGYSPHPLSTYLGVITDILSSEKTSLAQERLASKPFIISITASDARTLRTMVTSIQNTLRYTPDGTPSPWAHRIAVELNTSCPNISGAPPPAYTPSAPPLVDLLAVLQEEFKKDTSLTIGLKLPPYVYQSQFHDILKVIAGLNFAVDGATINPIAFFTCTNTLGNTLLFSSQTATPSSSSSSSGPKHALPVPLGGLAGHSLHPLALGNVYTFSTLLQSAAFSDLKDIVVIGVGGVTDISGVQRMRAAGAQVVGAASLFGKYGPDAFQRLVDEST
ncbi:FMN-linked oxidoreductase [Pleurotus eryngii]|uniref:Dihydroorotate oxidase n=1 Tax=Pleurotus eryngii TaxID=5323 RepID=A0A9P5ZX07_PLEER|nr:FMN-linked oxidoreductase [Pleurotus eryngii]